MSTRVIPVLAAVAVLASASVMCAWLPARAGEIENVSVREVAIAGELPVWKIVTLGRHRGVDAVRNALEDARIVIGDSADEILGRPAFTFVRTPRTLNLVVRSVGELGFSVPGATLADVHAQALRLGFELCPEEVGPQLRLQYLNQPVGEFLHVAMKPQRRYDGEMTDFTLANSGAGLTLLGGSARPDLLVATNVRFVFVRPSTQQVAAD